MGRGALEDSFSSAVSSFGHGELVAGQLKVTHMLATWATPISGSLRPRLSWRIVVRSNGGLAHGSPSTSIRLYHPPMQVRSSWKKLRNSACTNLVHTHRRERQCDPTTGGSPGRHYGKSQPRPRASKVKSTAFQVWKSSRRPGTGKVRRGESDEFWRCCKKTEQCG